MEQQCLFLKEANDKIKDVMVGKTQNATHGAL